LLNILHSNIYSLLFIFTCVHFYSFAQTDSIITQGYQKYLDGEYDTSIKLFDEAALLDPENAEIYYLRGLSKFEAENIDGALSDLHIAIGFDDDYADAYYQIGFIQLTQNNLYKAMAAFDKVIEITPGFTEAYVNRGTVRCLLGDKKGAAENWETAKKLGASIPKNLCE